MAWSTNKRILRFPGCICLSNLQGTFLKNHFYHSTFFRLRHIHWDSSLHSRKPSVYLDFPTPNGVVFSVPSEFVHNKTSSRRLYSFTSWQFSPFTVKVLSWRRFSDGKDAQQWTDCHHWILIIFFGLFNINISKII